MASGKNKIIVYKDWIETIDELSDLELGKLMRHFWDYINDRDPNPLDDRFLNLAWKPIQSTLKRDLKAYEAKCQRNRTNGSAGGNATQKKRTLPNATERTPKVADKDSDTDSDKDTDRDSFPTDPFAQTVDIPKSVEDNLEDPNFSNALKDKVEELNESYVWTSADQHESNELERIIKKVVSKKSDNPKIELLIKCFELVYQDMGDFHHKNFGIGYMVRNWNKCYQAAKIEKDNRKKIASQR